MLATGSDALAGAQDFLPGGFNYADDAVTMPLQCGTQWDALAHVFYDGRMYGGRDVRLVTSGGARANSIDRIADGVVGRGVLLDLPRMTKQRWLEDGTRILPEHLDACAEAPGRGDRAGRRAAGAHGHDDALPRAEVVEGLLRRARARALGALRALALRARAGGGRHRHLGRRGDPERDARLLPAAAHDLAAQHGAARSARSSTSTRWRRPAPRTAATPSCSARRRCRSRAPSARRSTRWRSSSGTGPAGASGARGACAARLLARERQRLGDVVRERLLPLLHGAVGFDHAPDQPHAPPRAAPC